MSPWAKSLAQLIPLKVKIKEGPEVKKKCPAYWAEKVSPTLPKVLRDRDRSPVPFPFHSSVQFESRSPPSAFSLRAPPHRPGATTAAAAGESSPPPRPGAVAAPSARDRRRKGSVAAPLARAQESARTKLGMERTSSAPSPTSCSRRWRNLWRHIRLVVFHSIQVPD